MADRRAQRFILAHLFQFVLSWDALAQKNFIQTLGLVIFNTLFLIYAIIQIIEIKSLVTGTTKALLPIIPACVLEPVRARRNSQGLTRMIGLTEIVYLILFLPLYREFGWQIYKQIGADRRIKRYYKWYQVRVQACRASVPYV